MNQLPCYQPYEVSDSQMIVEQFLWKMNEKRTLDYDDITLLLPLTCSKSVLERKEYMKSPLRKGLILQHRERLRDVARLKKHGVPSDGRLVPNGIVPILQQTRAKKMSNLKATTLQEMNPTTESIYVNRILELTIIEEPNQYSNSIQLVAEDDNGDTTLVYFDEVEMVTVLLERFAAGSRIAVINPYMGTCSIGRVNGIRINEPKCIIFLDKVHKMCRFCGVENASLNCSNCKQMYCSRECRMLDWQLFEHKLICSLEKSANPHNKSNEL